MTAADAQIRTGKSGWPAIFRMSAQSYRSSPRAIWMSRREQSIDERCIASVIISARPPRASCIGGVFDVRPRSRSRASKSQFSVTTDRTCVGIEAASNDAMPTPTLPSSPRAHGNRAASTPQSALPAAMVGNSHQPPASAATDAVRRGQIIIGRSIRSASSRICDGANLRPSETEVMNRLPSSARFAERAKSTISTKGPVASSIGGLSRSADCIHSPAFAHQSLISIPTITPIVAPPASFSNHELPYWHFAEVRMMRDHVIKGNRDRMMLWDWRLHMMPLDTIAPAVVADQVRYREGCRRQMRDGSNV